jgi:hypothetical protein
VNVDGGRFILSDILSLNISANDLAFREKSDLEKLSCMLELNPFFTKRM